MLIRIPGSYCAKTNKVSWLAKELWNKKINYSCVDTWDRYKRPWGTISTVNNVDLGAAKVELGATICLGDVQGNLKRHRLKLPEVGGRDILDHTCSPRMRYWPLGRLLGIVKVNWVIPKASVNINEYCPSTILGIKRHPVLTLRGERQLACGGVEDRRIFPDLEPSLGSTCLFWVGSRDG